MGQRSSSSSKKNASNNNNNISNSKNNNNHSASSPSLRANSTKTTATNGTTKSITNTPEKINPPRRVVSAPSDDNTIMDGDNLHSSISVVVVVVPSATIQGGSIPDLVQILAIKRALQTQDEKTRILMLGLPGAGKSSLLTRICGGTREIHDLGNQKFKVRTLSTLGLHFTMWDVGDDQFVDPYWLRLYSERISVVCFVADSTTRLDDARRELFNVVALDEFKTKPICILATKGDSPNALSIVKFSETMELHEMPGNRKYKVFQSGGPSDALQQALDWMVRWDPRDGTFYNGAGIVLEEDTVSTTSSTTLDNQPPSPSLEGPTPTIIVGLQQQAENADPPTPEESRTMRKTVTPYRGSFVLTRAVERQQSNVINTTNIISGSLIQEPAQILPSTSSSSTTTSNNKIISRLSDLDASSQFSSDGYLALPRGGYLVVTKSAGSIQFGIPPETIKDSLMRGFTVPENFVILGEMFDRKLGLSKAEFEFPIYYRYFVCKSKVNIITTAQLEERIRRALKETLIGPGSDCHVEEDYPPGTPSDALPDFDAEGACLDPSRTKTTLDDVVRFTRFDMQAGATLGAVKIRPIHDPKQRKASQRLRYEVTENDHVIAQVPSHFKLHAVALGISGLGGGSAVATSSSSSENGNGSGGNLNSSFTHRVEREKYVESEKRHLTGMDGIMPTSLGGSNTGSTSTMTTAITTNTSSNKNNENGSFSTNIGGSVNPNIPLHRVESLHLDGEDATAMFEHHDEILAQQLPNYAPFDIPVFGVTMMGASHGFDASGRTTGFVLWMNRRGIMVDPPPDSSQILEAMGVPPRAIEAVFLTHTHADHDAGTFQKILRTKLIRLYATRTVEKSFVRKYSAITGFEEKFLRSMFDFCPVRCNEPLKVYDGYLKFFYTLHTIPCVGFEAHFNRHSIVYSADTRYDPEMILQMADEGKIGKRRAQELANFNFDHTVVLHELGVPPIHTPRKALEKAADDPKHYRKGEPLRKRLFIVHAGRNDGEGLGSQCQDWDTIRISAAQDGRNQTKEIVSLLSNVAWLEGVGQAKLEKLAQKCFIRKFTPGELVVEFPEAVPPDRLFLVMAGVAREDLEEGEERQNLFPIGCSFGEIGLLRQLDKLVAPSRAIPSAKLASPSNKPVGRKTQAARNLKDFPGRKIYAESTLYVCEVRNKDLLNVFNKSVLGDVRDKLQRFNGYPEDARWRAISRNVPLMHLLEQQLAVRDFLVGMTEDVLPYPQGHVFQDGRSSAPSDSAFVINEGCVRITLMTGAFSFRGNDVANVGVEPYEVGRGTVVGDFNALIKNGKSTYRITAVTDCEVFIIPRNALIEFLNDYPGARILFLDRVHYGWVLPPSVQSSAQVKKDLFGGMVVSAGEDKPF
jgi:CRP-like cAMP-binding protein/GTPase SAR1 family protein